MIELFHLVNQIHDFIASHELTPTKLLMISFVFFVVTTLCTREMMCWFLKVHSVRRDLRLLKKEMMSLQIELRQLRKALGKDTPEPEVKTDSPVTKTKSSPFKIFH
jgi:hypothetical protein